ncbi:MAG: Hydroxyacylglutathione hydrolase GloC [Chlamydiae bacterium]|nr:Hydroxyacylglutathione hydrolase GloC [Chlamydiota bacterium]
MIKDFPSGPFATNAYVVFCPNSKCAAIVDPSPESADNLINFLNEKELKLDKIILTHSHWDHFGDLKKVHTQYPVPVYVHAEDQENIKFPGSDGLPMFIPIEGLEPDFLLKDGDCIEAGELKFKVLHTPGHSPGGVCLYCEEQNILISGDTLFKGSIGNLSLPTAQPDRMWNSLDRLATLPSQTQVYPGHGEMTYIKDEPWLKNAKQIFN